MLGREGEELVVLVVEFDEVSGVLGVGGRGV